jgi:hypothetical protein
MFAAWRQNGGILNIRAFLAKKGEDFCQYPAEVLVRKEISMNGNARRKVGRQAKVATNRATILSVDAEAAPNSFRVSLQWRGTHDISDFDLQRLGKVLRIQDETENTGWVTIERCRSGFRLHHAT